MSEELDRTDSSDGLNLVMLLTSTVKCAKRLISQSEQRLNKGHASVQRSVNKKSARIGGFNGDIIAQVAPTNCL